MALFILFFVLPLPMLIWFFIRSKNRKIKCFLGIGIILFVAFLSFMVVGLWALDIEDLYGDKNEIYWEGSSGDSIKLIDANTKQVLATGILKKTWHIIHIKTNQKEIDILAWIKNETDDEFSDTRIEFKDGEIIIFVLYPQDKAHFIGNYGDPYTLDIDFILNKSLQHQLNTFEVNQQMGTAKRGLAKFYTAKNDTFSL